MWTNSLLKKNAWNSVKNHYWPALGVCFVAGILGANGSGGSSGSSYSSSSSGLESYTDSNGDVDWGTVIVIMLVAFMIMLFALAIGFAIQAFLGNVVRVGECKYFYDARNGDEAFGKLFDNFRNGKYMATVKTMFFMRLYIFLWTLCFYIPGIIKTYEYFLIPYLLAENPHLPKDRAFEISKKTMDGEKWNLFVLQLSFIGWYLLGLCACCIGMIFVQPYYEATMAEFYTCMRAKMLSYGYATEEELGGFGGGTTYGNNFGGNDFNGGNNFNDPYNTAAQTNPYNNAPVQNDPYNAAPAQNNVPYSNATPDPSPYNGDMPGITHDAYGNELNASDVAAPEVKAPEMDVPEVPAPEAPAPDFTAPEAPAPEAPVDNMDTGSILDNSVSDQNTDNDPFNM